jgi:hypothetical protein
MTDLMPGTYFCVRLPLDSCPCKVPGPQLPCKASESPLQSPLPQAILWDKLHTNLQHAAEPNVKPTGRPTRWPPSTCTTLQLVVWGAIMAPQNDCRAPHAGQRVSAVEHVLSGTCPTNPQHHSPWLPGVGHPALSTRQATCLEAVETPCTCVRATTPASKHTRHAPIAPVWGECFRGSSWQGSVRHDMRQPAGWLLQAHDWGTSIPTKNWQRTHQQVLFQQQPHKKAVI